MPKPVQASTYTFRDIIESGFLYVDKTRYLHEMVRYGKGIYFLSRPRRFGKSLMLSTLEEIFRGSKELFQGTWIATSDYQWQPYPIVRIDFSWNAVHDAATLQTVIDNYVTEIAESYQLRLEGKDYQTRFRNLLLQLSKTGKIVILIDEYDKPLIDNLDNLPEAIQIRKTLKNFYTIIKAMDRHIRFVFITGISKFSKVGVFSSMNHLDDLTMDPRFATALGITEKELGDNFTEHLAAFAQQKGVTLEALHQEIEKWYDGFCFVENCERVYNPFSTLQAIKKQRFANYWFESGTPNFLIKLIQEQDYDIRQLEQLEVSELGFSTYEIDNLSIIPLLFQTGYLTIKGYNEERRLYTLYYPNYEVENAFLVYLLNAFSAAPQELSESVLWKMIDALKAQNLKQFFAELAVLFANVPYGIHLKDEKYYQSLFVLLFKLLGLRIEAEVQTNEGRIDAVIELSDQIYLFEFKLDKSAETALKQIKDHEYYQKYRGLAKPLMLVGVDFDSKKGKVSDWKPELEQAA